MSSDQGDGPPNRNHETPAPPDPSMEDILASIRRILNEEEAKPTVEVAAEDDVLELDDTMMLPETDPPTHDANQQPAAPEIPPVITRPDPELAPAAALEPGSHAASGPALQPPVQPVAEAIPPAPPLAVPFPPALTPPLSPSLVAPEAAAAAAVAVSALMRTLASERSTAVHRGGPTIEDLVREEIRPMLAAWLDANLPPLVERLVRTEIERVVSRLS